MKRSGFTLIELLIVIAIIAILAMIAVPNFLEAQTRAKTTKTIANFRTATVALESYMVDWGAYPTGYRTLKKVRYDDVATFDEFPVDFVGTVFPLSTPVAYMSSAQSLTDPFSPFHHQQHNENGGQGEYAPAIVGSLMYQRCGPHVNTNTWVSNSIGTFTTRQGYVLFSFGPDMKYDRYQAWQTSNPLESFIRVCTLPNPGFAMPQELRNTTYDPSNGTSSGGDIFKFGGQAINLAQGIDSTHGR